MRRGIRVKPTAALRLAAVMVVAIVGTGVVAEDGPRPLQGGERVIVAWSVLATPFSGPTATTLGARPELGIGEDGLPMVFAFDAPACVRQMKIGQPPEGDDFARAWSVAAKVTGASIDRIALDVRWERRTREADGAWRRAAGDSISGLVLREGESVLLDYMEPLEINGNACARNLALEVGASIKEDPALARKSIAYEVWLVHETPGGGRENQHWSGISPQGAKVAFNFRSETLPSTSGGTAPTLEVAVDGDVRGRLRPDGTLDLSFSARRSLMYSGVGEHLGGDGAKRISVRPGEAVRMELPGPPCTSGAPPPCATDSDSIRQPFGRDMAGHSFALIVTAKPSS
jgi:hypothetical protein